MMVLLIGEPWCFFSKDCRGVGWLYPACVLIAVGLVAAFTRSMWMGAAVGGGFLLWCRRPALILALPVAAGLLVLANPFQLRDRVFSIFQPHGDLDSNAHRALTRLVGWEMIKAHPLLGVGPEQVGRQFESYVPAYVPRPIPRGYYGHLHNTHYHFAAERGIPALGDAAVAGGPGILRRGLCAGRYLNRDGYCMRHSPLSLPLCWQVMKR